MLFSCFLQEIELDDFLKKGDTVLVAVSGGADSVCLLHLMCRLRAPWNLNLICAHVNHCLREEADDDAIFVERLCKKWEIPFVMQKIDVGKLAKEQKISVELAGREARYTFFKSIDANLIVTAHTKNDAAETVLLHLVRGCGLSGLCGIPRKRDDGIYRPILQFSRDQIEEYLSNHQIKWREDKSNQDVTYTRNKIRNEVMPRILEMNPAFLDTAERMTTILTAENVFMCESAKQYNCISNKDGVYYISLMRLMEMPIALQKRVISDISENADEVQSILDLAKKENGKQISLSGGRIAEKDYNEIAIYVPKTQYTNAVKLPQTGEVQFGNYRITVGNDGLSLPDKEYWIRTRRNGDCFSPEGVRGHKKIKDFFNEKKIPRRLRDEIPLITHNDKIAAVADWRRDNSFLPIDQKIIRIKVEPIKACVRKQKEGYTL